MSGRLRHAVDSSYNITVLKSAIATPYRFEEVGFPTLVGGESPRLAFSTGFRCWRSTGTSIASMGFRLRRRERLIRV